MDIFYTILVIAAVIFFMIIPLARMLILDVYPYMKDASAQEKALQKGIATNAEIVDVIQTTIWTGSKPLFKLKLRFKTENGQTIESTIMKALTFKEIETYKEGCQVTIKYLPDDPRKVGIVENL